MKIYILKLVLILALVSGFSCIVENSKSNGEFTHISGSQDAAEDAEFTPADSDLACIEHSDCDIIEKGCCFHEKAMAVAKFHSSDILQKKHDPCRKLRADFRKEQEAKKKDNPNIKLELCSGREGSSDWLATSHVECKKENNLKEPVLDDFIKEIKNPIERTKKYKEALETWRKTPGKCTLLP